MPWEGALLHLLAVHLDVCNVVLEDGGDVDLWELVLAEDDEEAGLPTGPVAHNHQLLSDSSHGWGWQERGSGDLGRGLVSPKAFLWAPEAEASSKRRAVACADMFLLRTSARATGLGIPYPEPPPMGQNTEVGGGKPSHVGARQHEF